MNEEKKGNLLPLELIHPHSDLAKKLGLAQSRFGYGELLYCQEPKRIYIRCLVVYDPEIDNFGGLLDSMEKEGFECFFLESPSFDVTETMRAVLKERGFTVRVYEECGAVPGILIRQWERQGRNTGRAGAVMPMQSDKKGSAYE